jgi:hypothetical protein
MKNFLGHPRPTYLRITARHLVVRRAIIRWVVLLLLGIPAAIRSGSWGSWGSRNDHRSGQQAAKQASGGASSDIPEDLTANQGAEAEAWPTPAGSTPPIGRAVSLVAPYEPDWWLLTLLVLRGTHRLAHHRLAHHAGARQQGQPRRPRPKERR